MHEPRVWYRLGLSIMRILIVGFIAALPVVGSATAEQTRVETVALGAARSARIEIALEAGQLHVTGGSLAGSGRPLAREDLVRGEFSAGTDTAPPAMRYEVRGEAGHLAIEQATGGGFTWPWEHHDARWAVALNPTVPTDLRVALGAGECELYLGGLTLTGLAVKVGAGETTLDFTGDWQDDLAATIESGAGELAVLVPRDLGVRIDVEQGAGTIEADGFTAVDGVYVNDAHGQSAVTLDLVIEQGAGDIRLELV